MVCAVESGLLEVNEDMPTGELLLDRYLRSMLACAHQKPEIVVLSFPRIRGISYRLPVAHLRPCASHGNCVRS